MIFSFFQGNTRSQFAQDSFEKEAIEIGMTMISLLQKFKEIHPDCSIKVDGGTPEEALSLGFTHRCHVEIIKVRRVLEAVK
jgi:hypothetical protein